jgi:branched-chain amino acid aminotransferase
MKKKLQYADMIKLYRLGEPRNGVVTLPDMSSLDTITRQLPDGYYSTFRTYAGCTRVIGLSAHLRRLPTENAPGLRRNLIQWLEPYRPGEARVRIIETKQGQIYVAIEPLKPLPRDVYEKGVQVETTSVQRNNPRAKSTAFISISAEERKHIAREGIFEALLVKNGKILEGMTSNFFYVVWQEGIPPYLGTAQRDILLGVTRTMVIRAARGQAIEVRYRALELTQLPAVKEAFITSSSRGIVPVVQIDDVQVGKGKVGPITKKLISAYEADILKNSEAI